jgi:trans-aconitate 2-methyltransferase
MHQWKPNEYLKFEEERTLAVRELLNALTLKDPKLLIDLGCGPGNSTAALAANYPKASQVIGIDSSLEMLAAAQQRLPEVDFHQADLTTWDPPPAADLLLANAVYQWVPQHVQVIGRQLKILKSGAAIAFQVPDNLDEPSHVAMSHLAKSNKWSEYFQEPIKREFILSPSAYYNRLKPLCQKIDLWHVVYRHILEDAEALIDWVRATGLAPYLERLPFQGRQEFLADYRAIIKNVYPKLYDGRVMFNFPRLFCICYKK